MSKNSFLITIIFVFASFGFKNGLAQKGNIGVGISCVMLTRMGFNISYFITDKVALEIHFGVWPTDPCGFLSMGVSSRFYPIKKFSKFYYIVGLGSIVNWCPCQKDSSDVWRDGKCSHYGPYLGLGNEIGFENRHWKVPIEAGAFWSLLSKSIEFKNISKKTKKVHSFQYNSFVIPFMGYAIMYYSKGY